MLLEFPRKAILMNPAMMNKVKIFLLEVFDVLSFIIEKAGEELKKDNNTSKKDNKGIEK
jgi:hypothetical protein